MKILKSNISKIAGDFLEILEREKITSLENVKNYPNKRIDKTDKEFIIGGARPSNLGSTTYRLSYTFDKGDIPIELVFNEEFGYFQVILKSQDRISGFKGFPNKIEQRDRNGNLRQYKPIFCDDLFSGAKKELEKLVDMY